MRRPHAGLPLSITSGIVGLEPPGLNRVAVIREKLDRCAEPVEVPGGGINPLADENRIRRGLGGKQAGHACGLAGQMIAKPCAPDYLSRGGTASKTDMDVQVALPIAMQAPDDTKNVEREVDDPTGVVQPRP